MFDPLNKDVYGVVLLILFFGGVLFLQGASSLQHYKQARERIGNEGAEKSKDNDPTLERRSLVRLTLAAVAGTMMAITIAGHTNTAFGWMFESGVALAIILSHPRWTATTAILLMSVRYGLSDQSDARIMRNPWSVYPLLGTVAFILLGIPTAAVSQHRYDPAYLTIALLPFVFATWVVFALEPLVKRLAPLPRNHRHLLWSSAVRHPSMFALIGAIIFATVMIIAIHDSGALAFSGFFAYFGGMVGIMIWEGNYGAEARQIRANARDGVR